MYQATKAIFNETHTLKHALLKITETRKFYSTTFHLFSLTEHFFVSIVLVWHEIN